MSLEIQDWDVSEYLDSEEAIASFLNAVIEENDPELLQAAIGAVAKARGMTDIAKSAGVGRASLYKSLSTEGNPSFQTIAKVANSMGLKLEFVPC